MPDPSQCPLAAATFAGPFFIANLPVPCFCCLYVHFSLSLILSVLSPSSFPPLPADFQQDGSAGSCSRFLPVKREVFLTTGLTWGFWLWVSASVKRLETIPTTLYKPKLSELEQKHNCPICRCPLRVFLCLVFFFTFHLSLSELNKEQ